MHSRSHRPPPDAPDTVGFAMSCQARGEHGQHEESTVANGEAETAQLAKRRASAALRFARSAITGLLLLIVIAGIGAASPASSGRGPLNHDALAVGVALELVLACLEIALAVAARRTAAAGQPAAALRAALQRVIAVAMIVVVVIAVANIAARKRGGLLQHFLSGRKPSPRKRAPLQVGLPGGAADHGGYLVYGVIGVVVAAALIALIVVVARARARPRRLGGYADEPPADEQDDLRRAIDSGLRALQAVDDARAAIIACYVAMEASLASAGTARTVAETPDELLSRAAAAGLVRGPAAATLTQLFYEARFSTHPLAPGAKDAAQQAIDAISAELASRAAPPTASEPAAGVTT
jgi:hypothetical protein